MATNNPVSWLPDSEFNSLSTNLSVQVREFSARKKSVTTCTRMTSIVPYPINYSFKTWDSPTWMLLFLILGTPPTQQEFFLLLLSNKLAYWVLFLLILWVSFFTAPETWFWVTETRQEFVIAKHYLKILRIKETSLCNRWDDYRKPQLIKVQSCGTESQEIHLRLMDHCAGLILSESILLGNPTIFWQTLNHWIISKKALALLTITLHTQYASNNN